MIKQNIKSSPNLSNSIKTLLHQLQHPQAKKTNKIHKQASPSILEIKKSMKSTWKDPGFCSIEFGKPQAIKQVRLSDWQRNRVNIPQRSYKYPKDYKGLRCDFFSREFKSPFKNYSMKKLQKNINFQSDNSVKKKENCENLFSKTLKFHCANDNLFGFPKNKGSLKLIRIQTTKQNK